MKRIIEQIIDRNTEGNYLLSSSDKAQMVSEMLDLLGVIGRLLNMIDNFLDRRSKVKNNDTLPIVSKSEGIERRELLFFGEWIFDQYNLNKDVPVSEVLKLYLSKI